MRGVDTLKERFAAHKIGTLDNLFNVIVEVFVVGHSQLISGVLARLDQPSHMRLGRSDAAEDRLVILGLFASITGGGLLENDKRHSVSLSWYSYNIVFLDRIFKEGSRIPDMHWTHGSYKEAIQLAVESAEQGQRHHTL